LKYQIFPINGGMFVDGKEHKEYTLYIENVYKGSKFDDTCIAEVLFVGVPLTDGAHDG
jgi:hypothetical protein